MYRFFRKKKGQSTLEYAILIIVIIGALLSIQVYIKRGIQGRLKSATDDIGDQFSVGNQNVLTTTVTSSRTADLFDKGITTSEMLDPELTTVNMTSNVINVEQEFWGN
ncbi:MAG: hypothetical protein A2787_05505 [Omnitrophica WOR_2 bacterium RIFCSPHIGHO2_01_FULL_48_9]|nr:MAG: hypothetical protein A3D10_06250 [Omnitrophica WOR_2 bacterium RIFCSPHIGHO2_02_FULL_48_11]OGX32835.1 MAG: hypothetical protein A2787_05505 [Omnitrophica WOR_2 bacterium RIFCSPHIGHO2_01_FULL_48_9]